MSTVYHHFAGLDLARASSVLVVLDAQGRVVLEAAEFRHDPAGLRALLDRLAGFDALALALEPTGPTSSKLLQALDAAVPVYQINAQLVRRRAMSLVQTKTDPADARALAQGLRDLALTQPERLAQLRVHDDPAHEELRLLVTEYLQRAEDLRRLRVQIDHLKQQISPAAKALIGRRDKEAARAKRDKERAAKELEQAAQRFAAADFERLQSIPGLGPINAAVLLCFIRRIDRFASADALKGYLGVYPRRWQSGPREAPAHLAGHGPAALKALLFKAAQAAARFNPVAKALYDRLLAKGKSKLAATAAVMRKLLHLVFGVLKNKQKFQVITPLPT